MAHVQAKQQLELERYKLDLVSEGKLKSKQYQGEKSTLGDLGSLPFDISANLRLIPRFNEDVPHIFFVLFERLAELV